MDALSKKKVSFQRNTWDETHECDPAKVCCVHLPTHPLRFCLALLMALMVKPFGFSMIATVCSSWVFMNRSTNLTTSCQATLFAICGFLLIWKHSITTWHVRRIYPWFKILPMSIRFIFDNHMLFWVYPWFQCLFVLGISLITMFFSGYILIIIWL